MLKILLEVTVPHITVPSLFLVDRNRPLLSQISNKSKWECREGLWETEMGF